MRILSFFTIFIMFSLPSYGQLKNILYSCEEPLLFLVQNHRHKIQFENSGFCVNVRAEPHVTVDIDSVDHNIFYLTTPSLDTVHLELILFHLNENKDTLFDLKKPVHIPVIPASNGELTLGNIRNGGVINLSELTISIEYPNDYPECLKINNRITLWGIQIEGGEVKLKGTEANLTRSHRKYLKHLPSGTMVTLSALIGTHPYLFRKIELFIP